MKYSFLFLCSVLAACNNNSTTLNADDTTGNGTVTMDTTAIATSTNNTACFAYQSANDTVLLTLTAIEPNVLGNLVYVYSGKDKNSGTVAGTMRGDTLLADYTFMSEGKSSVRQVAFLRKSDGFVEGYGDSKMEGGKTFFKNTGALTFGNTMILKKLPCTSL
jgi:hypothetical protein